MKSIEFVIERATATKSAQKTLAAAGGWVWPERTVADWTANLENLRARLEAESAARAAWLHAGGQWDAALEQLADDGADVSRLARTKFRQEPAQLRLWRGRRHRRNSRVAIYRGAVAVQGAWQAADAAWVPKTGLTLAAFTSQMDDSVTLGKINSAKEALWRQAAGELMAAAEALDRDCVAWYADATTHYGPETVNGMMIRSTVPTTTAPEPAAGRAVKGGAIRFDAAADHATLLIPSLSPSSAAPPTRSWQGV